jgi:hypothetical protein
VHLAVPERVFGLVVGLRDHQRQIALAQQRRAEQLVAALHAARGLGDDVLFDDVEQAIDQGRRHRTTSGSLIS